MYLPINFKLVTSLSLVHLQPKKRERERDWATKDNFIVISDPMKKILKRKRFVRCKKFKAIKIKTKKYD